LSLPNYAQRQPGRNGGNRLHPAARGCKPLTDPENRAAIAQYDELKRELEGEQPQGGRPPKNSLQCGEFWTQQKPAADLGISQQANGA